MDVKLRINEWLPIGFTIDELIAALDSLNGAAVNDYGIGVAQIVNEINEEAVYESKWRKSE